MLHAATALDMARRRAGLSQRELARRSGVPQPTISRIESARMQPSFALLSRLLSACGMEFAAIDAQAPDDVDRGLVLEWLRRSPLERARRVALEWAGTAPFRKAP